MSETIVDGPFNLPPLPAGEGTIRVKLTKEQARSLCSAADCGLLDLDREYIKLVADAIDILEKAIGETS